MAGDQGVQVIGHDAVRNYFEAKISPELQKLRRYEFAKLDVQEHCSALIDANRQEISVES